MRIGIDIQDTNRMESWIGTNKIKGVFTEPECEYCKNKNWSLDTVTGLYCAKEAFFKALGTGIIISHLHDVEIEHERNGAPYYKLSSRLINEYHLNTSKLHLSISHTKDVAVAVCIIIHHDVFI